MTDYVSPLNAAIFFVGFIAVIGLYVFIENKVKKMRLIKK